MISFRFKSQVKKVKIKTQQKLDERMSHWLQKVFGFKNQIIGFKSQDNKFYDVDSFYDSVQKFFGSNIDIIESGDQLQISFTSQNLNSSSFIRPSQPNTSQINHKEPFLDQFDDFVVVNDRRSFQNKLIDGKDISLLFDVNAIYRKAILEASQCLSGYNPFKINLFMYINNSHPKKSCISIYIGKNCVITFPLLKNYTQKIKSFLIRYKSSAVLIDKQNQLYLQARASHQQQDEAPSFTTYHLQQRLNQEAIIDYLTKMNKQKYLGNYQFHKLVDKCQQNFSQFYRIFCDGVIDNDYESFKNQILNKVQNNLELILSNVEQMDLSRPISRQQQRRHNLKKSVPQIQIVKVENYFQILDQLKNQIDSTDMNQIKKLLLDGDQQIYKYFAEYLSREISQQSLSFKLNNYLNKKANDKVRPNSRYVPLRNVKSKSVDAVRRKFSQEKQSNQAGNFILGNQGQNIQEPPMFGSVRNDDNFSPIKYVSDTQSIFKKASNKFEQNSNLFQPQQYGLLYYYLEKKDQCILSQLQQVDWEREQSFQNLRRFLKDKVQGVFLDNFTSIQINFLDQIRQNSVINTIYENFSVEWSLQNFISALKEQLHNRKSQSSQVKILHKKSSDSQLLDIKEKRNNRFGKRKFSDQNQIALIDPSGEPSPRSPSPKDSEYSLYNKNAYKLPELVEGVKKQWLSDFNDMLKDINFTDERKQRLFIDMFEKGNATMFGWIRNYIRGRQQFFSSQQMKDLALAQKQTKSLISILPIFDELLRLFVQDGLLTDKIRKWLIGEFVESSSNILSAFQLYLQTKQEEDFIETLTLIYQNQNIDMQFYNNYIQRLELLLKQMSIHDQIGLQIFQLFPTVIKSICQLYFITGNLEDMMDTLETLYKIQTELRTIKVANLNFSGINTSPLEYSDDTQQVHQLNDIFKALLNQKCPQRKEWAIGKIDKEVQIRQSLCYCQGFKLTQDNRLPNKQQFQALWRQTFSESKTVKSIPTESEIYECFLLDYFIYLTVIKYVYQKQDDSQVESRLNQYDPSKLIEFLQGKRKKPQCSNLVKQKMLINYMLEQSIDVMFLQQANNIDWGLQMSPKFTWKRTNDSVIIYNIQKIGQQNTALTQAYEKLLNINDDSACIFSKKHYLLVSSHLRSSKVHLDQIKLLFGAIDEVLTNHPMMKMIVGIDANHFISTQKLNDSLRVKYMPENDLTPTTVKKRSYLQAQLKKADEQVSEVKDFIISNRQIASFKIQTVMGKQVTKQQKQFLPNDHHPYDHFVLSAQII